MYFGLILGLVYCIHLPSHTLDKQNYYYHNSDNSSYFINNRINVCTNIQHDIINVPPITWCRYASMHHHSDHLPPNRRLCRARTRHSHHLSLSAFSISLACCRKQFNIGVRHRTEQVRNAIINTSKIEINVNVHRTHTHAHVHTRAHERERVSVLLLAMHPTNENSHWCWWYYRRAFSSALFAAHRCCHVHTKHSLAHRSHNSSSANQLEFYLYWSATTTNHHCHVFSRLTYRSMAIHTGWPCAAPFAAIIDYNLQKPSDAVRATSHLLIT